MATIIMIVKVKSSSQGWEVYEYLKSLYTLLKTDIKEGGDLGMDVDDKGIYTLQRSGGQYHLVCKRENISKVSGKLNVLK